LFVRFVGCNGLCNIHYAHFPHVDLERLLENATPRQSAFVDLLASPTVQKLPPKVSWMDDEEQCSFPRAAQALGMVIFTAPNESHPSANGVGRS
jgi:hypothetical protein